MSHLFAALKQFKKKIKMKNNRIPCRLPSSEKMKSPKIYIEPFRSYDIAQAWGASVPSGSGLPLVALARQSAKFDIM